jgi:hypothetical protein
MTVKTRRPSRFFDGHMSYIVSSSPLGVVELSATEIFFLTAHSIRRIRSLFNLNGRWGSGSWFAAAKRTGAHTRSHPARPPRCRR